MCGLLAVFLFTPQKIFAARSLTITADKTVLNGYEDMTISVSSMSGFTDGETIYIKGAFYKDGSANYFGYTQSNSTWIKNGDSSINQRQIIIGGWDGKLVVKSDFDDSGYVGEGDYKVKVGFYYLTSGGNMSSVNWSNSIDITINNPDPTPTPTGPPPTNTPIPTNTPRPTPTTKPTATKSPTMSIASIAAESSVSGILGASISAVPSLVEGMKKTNANWLPLLFIVGGILLVSACGILFYYQWKKGKLTHEVPND